MKEDNKQSLPVSLLVLGVFLFSISNFNTGDIIEKVTTLLGFLLGSIGAIWMSVNYKKSNKTAMFVFTLLIGLGTIGMLGYFVTKLF